MPIKAYQIWLNESTYIAVDFTTVKGRVVSFVVRLMWLSIGQEVNVVRYDTAHGSPHRDLLGRRSGLIKKEWYFDQPMGRVLRNAIDDFKLNYERYIETFKAN